MRCNCARLMCKKEEQNRRKKKGSSDTARGGIGNSQTHRLHALKTKLERGGGFQGKSLEHPEWGSTRSAKPGRHK